MQVSEFETRFPHLYKVVYRLKRDSDLHFNVDLFPQGEEAYEMAALEEQASRLNDSQKDVFACGTDDDGEITDLMIGFDLLKLDVFLTRALNGDLSREFWRF